MGKTTRIASKSSKLRHVVRAVRRRKNPTQRVRLLQDMEGLARSIKEMRLHKYQFDADQPRPSSEESEPLSLEGEVGLAEQQKASTDEPLTQAESSKKLPRDGMASNSSLQAHHQYLMESENGRRLLQVMTESEHILKKNMLAEKELKKEEKEPAAFETKEKSELNELELSELERQKRQLHALNREYNTARVAVAQQEEEHSRLKFTLYDLQEKEEKVTLLVRGRDKIEDFEAHKVMTEEYIRMAEELEHFNKYRKTLALMTRRLNQYKLIYDGQVVDMRSKVKECARVLKLQKLDLEKAEASKNKSIEDLEEAGARCERDLCEWKDKLKSRKEQVANLNRILKFREDQIHKSRKIIASVKGDLSEEGEQKLQRKVLLTKAKQRQLQQDLSSCSEKVDEYETAFRRIINSTGINDTTEVVNKYITQEATRDHLTNMVNEANRRIRDMTKEKQHISMELERLRFSGLGSYNKHRKLLDDREESIAVLKRQVDHVQNKSDSLTQTVGDLRTVTEKLIRLLNELNLRDATSASSPNIAAVQDNASTNGPSSFQLRTGDDFVEALRSCEHKIRRVLSVLPRSIEALHDLDDTVLESYMRSQIKVKRIGEEDEELEEEEKPQFVQPEVKRKNCPRKQNGKKKLRIDVEAKRNDSLIDPTIDNLEELKTHHTHAQQHDHRRPSRLSHQHIHAIEEPSLKHSPHGDSEAEEELVIAEAEGRKLLKAESSKLVKFAEKKRKKLRKMIESGSAAGNKRLQSLISAADKDHAIESYVASLVSSEAQRSPVYSQRRRHKHKHHALPADDENDLESALVDKEKESYGTAGVTVESAEAQMEL